MAYVGGEGSIKALPSEKQGKERYIELTAGDQIKVRPWNRLDKSKSAD
jgi:hypothetical protein